MRPITSWSWQRPEQKLEEWQTATEALIMAAEGRGPLLHARVGMLRALNRHVERVFNPDRKDPHWGKRKLARDRWTALQQLIRRTQPPVCLARPLFDLVGKRGKSQGYLAVGHLCSHAAQLDDLLLKQDQPFDVTDHEGRL
jgi:hypothetical protein